LLDGMWIASGRRRCTVRRAASTGLALARPAPPRVGGITWRASAVLLATWVNACAAAPPPERTGDACSSAHTVYAVDHGRHAGLIVSREALIDSVPALASSLPDGPYVEIGWGDARYYREPDPGVWLGLRAVLWPTDSVLHLVVLPDEPAEYFRASRMLALPLTDAGHDALMTHVADTFAADGERLGPPLYGEGGFYPARGGFHLLNTCNTWLARGIARAGVSVSSAWLITADGLMERLQATACAERVD